VHLVTRILSARQGNYDRAAAPYEESLTLYRTMGHRNSTSRPLRELGVAAYYRGDYDSDGSPERAGPRRVPRVRERVRLRPPRLRSG
jgi:hypothetical protein